MKVMPFGTCPDGSNLFLVQDLTTFASPEQTAEAIRQELATKQTHEFYRIPGHELSHSIVFATRATFDVVKSRIEALLPKLDAMGIGSW